MAEHVVLFAGPMGAGKTTAIETLSDIPVVRTEATNTDRAAADKDTTTVALDYGEISLDDVDKVRLYGVPGQQRFDFMWTILMERARGLVLLVNRDAADPIESTIDMLRYFDELHSRGAVIVGITRSDTVAAPSIDEFVDAISAAYPDRMIPIFTVDAREKNDMHTLLTSLIASIEMRELLTADSAAETGGVS